MSLNASISLNKENVLKKVSQKEILQNIIGLKLEKKTQNIHSIIRDDDDQDNVPSMTISEGEKGSILWYDHARGVGGDVFDLINIKFKTNSFYETLELINKEMGLRLIKMYYHGVEDAGKNNQLRTKRIPVTEREIKKLIIPVKREFAVHDISYWGKNAITTDTLKYFNVSALQEVWIGLENRIKATKSYRLYMYEQDAYRRKYEKRRRIYRADEKTKNKYLGNASTFELQGYDQLPESGDLLVITKSLKEVMFLHEIDVVAIAPHSETSGIPEILLQDLYRRFRRFVSMFDLDEAGREGIKKLHATAPFPIKDVTMPPGIKIKDLTDLARETSASIARNVAIDLINKVKNVNWKK